MKETKDATARLQRDLQRLRNLPEFTALLEWLDARAKDHARAVVHSTQPNLTPILQGRAQEAEAIAETLKEITK